MAVTKFFPQLEKYVENVVNDYNLIDANRKTNLENLSKQIASELTMGKTAKLTFICTHNSRRSHMSQIWAQTAAHFYGIPGIETFSGGTEATAFNPNAVKVMQQAGFVISRTSNLENPVYDVRYTKDAKPLKSFSKIFDEAGNPKAGFAAIMNCSHADQNCPFVPGAYFRISINYEDPKNFDGTPQQEAVYGERCMQIAREMFYVMNNIGK